MLKQLLDKFLGQPKRKLDNVEAMAERSARERAPARIISAFKDFAAADQCIVAAPVDDYLHLMSKEIEELKHEIGFDKEDYESTVAPMLRRYFEWVHLLPASASNHHARLGGLALHGVHVATLAARAAHNSVFDFSPQLVNDTELKSNRRPRWQLAAAAAGLIHDIGKVLVDQIVSDADTGQVWNPFACSLAQWIKDNDVKTYAVRYRSGDRLNRHETITVTMFGEIAGTEVKGALSHYGRDMYEAVMMSISGERDDDFGLRKIVHQADMDSTRLDKEARIAYWNEGGDGADPLINRMLQTIPELIKNRSWFINRLGNPIWINSDGVYLMWPQAFNGMRNQLVATFKATGIPNDANEMANAFIRAKVAKPRTLANGQVVPLWAIHLPEPDRATAGNEAAQRMAEFKAQFGSVGMALYIPDVQTAVGSTPIVHTADIRIADDTTMTKIEVVGTTPEAAPNTAVIPTADQSAHPQPQQPPQPAATVSESVSAAEPQKAAHAQGDAAPAKQSRTQGQAVSKPADEKRTSHANSPSSVEIMNFDDELDDKIALEMAAQMAAEAGLITQNAEQTAARQSAEQAPTETKVPAQTSLIDTPSTVPAVLDPIPVPTHTQAPASSVVNADEEKLRASGPFGEALIRVAHAVAGVSHSNYPTGDMVVVVSADEVLFKWPNSVRDLITNLVEVKEQLEGNLQLLADLVKGQKPDFRHGITTAQRIKGKSWNVVTPNKELCSAYTALVERLKASK